MGKLFDFVILDSKKARTLAKRREMSVRELSAASGLSENHLKLLFYGRYHECVGYTIQALCKALWCKPEEIIGTLPEMEKHLKGLNVIIASDPDGRIAGGRAQKEAESLKGITERAKAWKTKN